MQEDQKNVDKQDDEILCRRCGRRLRGSKSRELGFGPACYRAWKGERIKQLGLFSSLAGDENAES